MADIIVMDEQQIAATENDKEVVHLMPKAETVPYLTDS